MQRAMTWPPGCSRESHSNNTDQDNAKKTQESKISKDSPRKPKTAQDDPRRPTERGEYGREAISPGSRANCPPLSRGGGAISPGSRANCPISPCGGMLSSSRVPRPPI
eukprot:12415739-Karenia_brevis.AAC.1